ncbi:DUF3558 family protein [Nocardia sp. NPDC056064]|uniref:DUF3558 family protein n=1 Tax=Nocardia sp. NPDC056064 TaxID=3345701 RepID=UPI0035E020B1
MFSATRKVRSLPVGLLVSCAVLVTGCSSDPGSTAATETTASTTSAQSADFDPCIDIPEEFLKRENLTRGDAEDFDNGQIRTHGCAYFKLRGQAYDVRIVRTTVTLDDIDNKFADSYREVQFGDRTAAFYVLFPKQGAESCVLNLEMATGSLEFDLSNPASSKTGGTDSCELLSTFVNNVIPYIPEGA